MDAMVGMQAQPEVRKGPFMESVSCSGNLTIDRPGSVGSCAGCVRKPPRLLDLSPAQSWSTAIQTAAHGMWLEGPYSSPRTLDDKTAKSTRHKSVLRKDLSYRPPKSAKAKAKKADPLGKPAWLVARRLDR